MKKQQVKKICAIMISGMLLTGSLSGCGTQNDTSAGNTEAVETTEDAKTDETDAEAIQAEDGTYTLQVSSIDENEITGITGELMEPGEGDMPEGAPEDMPENSDGETMSEPPSDSEEMSEDFPSDGEMPDEMPSDMEEDNEFSGGGEMPGGGEFTGDAIKFSLSDDTTITVESAEENQEGSAEDIAENSILEVTIQNGIAVEITIKNSNRGGGGARENDTNTTDTDSGAADESNTTEIDSDTAEDSNALT